MKKFADLTYRKQQKVVAFLFLLVPVALTIVFGYFPFVSMIEYSFMRWDGMGEKEFIGFKNYVDALTRPENYRVFKVALYYLVASVVQIALALFFATILSFNCLPCVLISSSVTKFLIFHRRTLTYLQILRQILVKHHYIKFLKHVE